LEAKAAEDEVINGLISNVRGINSVLEGHVVLLKSIKEIMIEKGLMTEMEFAKRVMVNGVELGSQIEYQKRKGDEEND